MDSAVVISWGNLSWHLSVHTSTCGSSEWLCANLSCVHRWAAINDRAARVYVAYKHIHAQTDDRVYFNGHMSFPERRRTCAAHVTSSACIVLFVVSKCPVLTSSGEHSPIKLERNSKRPSSNRCTECIPTDEQTSHDAMRLSPMEINSDQMFLCDFHFQIFKHF